MTSFEFVFRWTQCRCHSGEMKRISLANDLQCIFLRRTVAYQRQNDACWFTMPQAYQDPLFTNYSFDSICSFPGRRIQCNGIGTTTKDVLFDRIRTLFVCWLWHQYISMHCLTLARNLITCTEFDISIILAWREWSNNLIWFANDWVAI